MKKNTEFGCKVTNIRTRDSAMGEELFWTALSEIKQKYPDFITSGCHYPGLPWRFKRAIHIVDTTTIKLIAKCLDRAKHREQKAAAKCIWI